MKIYFNWLGEWKELDDENDYIEDMSPSEFIAMRIRTYEPLHSLDNIAPKYIKIKKEDNYYFVQISQLVWSEPIKRYSDN